jgi:hypothetical protein
LFAQRQFLERANAAMLAPSISVGDEAPQAGTRCGRGEVRINMALNDDDITTSGTGGEGPADGGSNPEGQDGGADGTAGGEGPADGGSNPEGQDGGADGTAGGEGPADGGSNPEGHDGGADGTA